MTKDADHYITQCVEQDKNDILYRYELYEESLVKFLTSPLVYVFSGIMHFCDSTCVNFPNFNIVTMVTNNYKIFDVRQGLHGEKYAAPTIYTSNPYQADVVGDYLKFWIPVDNLLVGHEISYSLKRNTSDADIPADMTVKDNIEPKYKSY